MVLNNRITNADNIYSFFFLSSQKFAIYQHWFDMNYYDVLGFPELVLSAQLLFRIAYLLILYF